MVRGGHRKQGRQDVDIDDQYSVTRYDRQGSLRLRACLDEQGHATGEGVPRLADWMRLVTTGIC